MQPEDVKKCISSYRACSARCAYLEQEIVSLKGFCERLKNSSVEDAISITQKWSAMPHASGVSDPTGDLARKFADGYIPDYILEIEREIAVLEDEYKSKNTVIVYVESWLKALNDRELFVVKSQCINGMFWREVIYGFKEKFGEFYTQQGLKKLRDRAMMKIYEIAK